MPGTICVVLVKGSLHYCCDFEGYEYFADALAASAAVSMLAAALALPGTRPKLLLALAPAVESFGKVRQ